MDRSVAENKQKPQPESQTARRSGTRAIIVSAVGIAVVLAVAAASPAVNTERSGNARADGCASKAANDSHFIFEAFFQNPPERNALAQIANVCGQ